ncbi:MAG: M48 family metallopeptidase [Bacteroidota bacterium]|nr:M48 family metallopeptidase [Bacteroidota bacterium]
MMAKTILYIIIIILIFDYIVDRILEALNKKNWSTELPEELKDIYDKDKYKKAMDYDFQSGKLSLWSGTFSFMIMLTILLTGGFGYIDNFVRQYTENPILLAILFFGIIGLGSEILTTPFSYYSTFVIETKYGFNRTTIKTFITDKIKTLVLGAIIGGIILSVVIWIYEKTGTNFWIWAWITISIFMIFMTMFFSSIIVPLFNKQTPLEEGELRSSIENFCNKIGFKLDNIFVIDGSKRSSKANAYFSGLGRKKRIVLYDTLMNNHSIDEIVAILAHEVGHYKKKHTFKNLILGLAETGLMLYIFSLFINNESLSFALGATKHSFHIAILAFGLLYSPLTLILDLGLNYLSRRYEKEADTFAAKNYYSKSLQNALIKLSSDHLSNLNPHPFYVFFHYSHPPLLERLKVLKSATPLTGDN